MIVGHPASPHMLKGSLLEQMVEERQGTELVKPG